MAPSRLKDEEHGIRDDDKPWQRRGSIVGRRSLRYRWRRKRTVAAIILILVLAFFFNRRIRFPTTAYHYYDGPLQFPHLGASLEESAPRYDRKEDGSLKRDVVFAASSLNSATIAIPMACEMARWGRNSVHMIILGRSQVPLKDIQEINGVDPTGCGVTWHDARPDYAEYSTESRARESVITAFNHFQRRFAPQAVIMDDPTIENAFFVDGIRAKTSERRIPLIELPRKGAESLKWITRLDSTSLRAWHLPTVDILVHAPEDSSASFVGLIKSLQAADYRGLPTPRLIIELPANPEPHTLRFLDNFEWPPRSVDNGPQPNHLVIRRRLPSRSQSPEESSLHFMESFYPTKLYHHHVFVVSPYTQLSPAFYHYLFYALLKYRYDDVDSPSILGFSLEVPTTHLNGSSPFTPPPNTDLTGAELRSAKYPSTTEFPAPFRWQAPNGHAALYLSEKWLELQSFLTHRIATFHGNTQPPARPKLVSSASPVWMEYVLEFMRARGYTMHYPALGTSSRALATVHTELAKAPGELASIHVGEGGPLPDEQGAPIPSQAPASLDRADPFLPTQFPSTAPYAEKPLVGALPIHQILPWDGDLPELAELPLLSFTGKEMSPAAMFVSAMMFTERFQLEVGGCERVPERTSVEGPRPWTADDLFCVKDER